MFRTDWHLIQQFEEAIGYLQTVKAKAKHYKYNFVLGYLTTGEKSKEVPDWFDNEFESLVNNLRTHNTPKGFLRGSNMVLPGIGPVLVPTPAVVYPLSPICLNSSAT